MTHRDDIRLGSEMIKVAQYLIDTSYFEELKTLSIGIGKHYVALDLIIRRIIERDFLGMAFSPYLMNLDRYTIIASLKEMPSSWEEFWRIASSLPYDVWLRYIGIPSIPKKTIMLTYTIPTKGSIDSVVAALEEHPAIDRGKDIDVYKFRYTYYTKPRRFSAYFKRGIMMTMSSAKELILDELEEKEPVDPTELVRKRSDPLDIVDVIMMSYLEAKYLVTPIWTYRKIGALKLHERTLKKHFKRHIRDKYYLGIYLKRPPNPGIINTVVIAIISGRDALGVAYRMTRTPYAAATCDHEKKNRCLIQFFCREEDLVVITEILNSYKIDVEKYIFSFHRASPQVFHERRTLPFPAYDDSSKRWYGLEEAIKMAPIVAPEIIKRYFKAERIPSEIIPVWLRKEAI